MRFKEEFTRKNNQFIVMEHMAGGDLQQYIEERDYTPLPVDMA